MMAGGYAVLDFAGLGGLGSWCCLYDYCWLLVSSVDIVFVGVNVGFVGVVCCGVWVWIWRYGWGLL